MDDFFCCVVHHCNFAAFEDLRTFAMAVPTALVDVGLPVLVAALLLAVEGSEMLTATVLATGLVACNFVLPTLSHVVAILPSLAELVQSVTCVSNTKRILRLSFWASVRAHVGCAAAASLVLAFIVFGSGAVELNSGWRRRWKTGMQCGG